MQKWITGALLWALLLPVFGGVRFLWWALSAVAWLKPKSWMTVVGLIVVWETGGVSALQLRPDVIESMRHLILVWTSVVVGILVLYHGLRSPESRKLWRRLRQQTRLDTIHPR